jgi:hypothetical protein
MIRILTLLVSLFSFGLVQLAEINYEIPVTDMLYFNDTPIQTLNNKTLNEIFIGTNLLTNGNFEVNINGWTSICGAGTLSRTTSDTFNGIGAASILTTFNFTSLHSQSISLTSSDVVYGFGYAKVVSGNPQYHRINAGTGSANVINIPNWQRLSFTGTNVTSFQFGQCFDNRTFNVLYDYLHLINLTSLGISSQTKAQMDRYYELWQNPELNITYEINELDTQDLVLLLASQSVWTITIHLLYKYAYRPKKKSKRLGM